MMNVAFLIELIGWIGAFFFLIAYYNLVIKRWESEQPIYHLFNILGGILLTINTVYFQTWAAAFINFAWGVIALAGFIKARSGN